METAPDAHDAQGSAGFSELKMSNARRYEVLTEILTSLGLRCELSQVPPLSPIYLLDTHTVRRASASLHTAPIRSEQLLIHHLSNTFRLIGCVSHSTDNQH